jgi:hypothetical protein
LLARVNGGGAGGGGDARAPATPAGATQPPALAAGTPAAASTPAGARALIERAIARSARKPVTAAVFTPRHGGPPTGALARVLAADPAALSFARFCELAGLRFVSEEADASAGGDGGAAAHSPTAGATAAATADDAADDGFDGGLSPSRMFAAARNRRASTAAAPGGGRRASSKPARRKSSILSLAAESSASSAAAAEAALSAQKRLLARVRAALLGHALLGRERDYIADCSGILRSFVASTAPAHAAAVEAATGGPDAVSARQQPVLFAAVWRAAEILSTAALEGGDAGGGNDGEGGGVDATSVAEAEALLARVGELKAAHATAARGDYLTWRLHITHNMAGALAAQLGALREEAARLTAEAASVTALQRSALDARLRLSGARATAVALADVAAEVQAVAARANAAREAHDDAAAVVAARARGVAELAARRDALLAEAAAEAAAAEAEAAAYAAAVDAEAARKAAGQADPERERGLAAARHAAERYAARCAATGWAVAGVAAGGAAATNGAAVTLATLMYRHPDGSRHSVTVAISGGKVAGVRDAAYTPPAGAAAGGDDVEGDDGAEDGNDDDAVAEWAARHAGGGLREYYAAVARAAGAAAFSSTAGGYVPVRLNSAAAVFRGAAELCARVHALRGTGAGARFTRPVGAGASGWTLALDLAVPARRAHARVTLDVAATWDMHALAAGLPPAPALHWAPTVLWVCGTPSREAELATAVAAALQGAAGARGATAATVVDAVAAACAAVQRRF